MKTIKLTSIITCLVALASIPAQADYIEVSPQPIAITLTAKYQFPGVTWKEDEETYLAYEGSTSVFNDEMLTKETTSQIALARTFKLGNAEILKAALSEGGVLEQYGPSTSGWSIVSKSEEGVISIIATKKINGEVIEEDIGLETDFDFSTPFTYNSSDVLNYTYKTITIDGEPFEDTVTVNTKTSAGTYQGPIGISFQFSSSAFPESELEANLVGALNMPYRGQQLYQRFRDEDDKIQTDKTTADITNVPSAGTVNGILGSTEAESEYGTSRILFSGSIRIQAAKAKIVLEDI
jgi:hypothetical protein